MKQLLSYKTIRLLNIAQALIIKEQNITTKIISTLNHCSNKTTEEDLTHLYTHYNPIMDLKHNKTIITSNNTSHYDFMNLKRNLYQTEIKIQIIISIFLFPNQELGIHADRLNYSESHLRRQIKPINHYLEPYKTQIEYNSKTFKYKLNTTNPLIQAIFITRLIQKSHNETLLPPLDQEEIKEFNLYKKEFPTLLKTQTTENYELLFKVIQHNTKTNKESKHIIQKIKQTHQHTQKKKETLQNQITNHFKINDMNINPQDQKTILEMLLHITFKATLFPHKIDNTWNRYDFFLETFKQENNSTYQRFNHFLERLSETNYEPYKSELAFNLYTMIDSLKHPTPYTIGIYSDLGHTHAKSLVNTYQQHFSNHNIEIYEESINYDLILSTHSHINNQHNNTIIKVSDHIKLSDIQKVHKFISMN